MSNCPTCSQPYKGFKDKLSEKEYQISGMCQDCQDSVFGATETRTPVGKCVNCGDYCYDDPDHCSQDCLEENLAYLRECARGFGASSDKEESDYDADGNWWH